jgi:hypothetical protein
MMLCPDCLATEKAMSKAPAKQKQPKIDDAEITDVVKSAVAEAMKDVDISRIEAAVEKIGKNISIEMQKYPAQKPAEQELYLPGTPSERRLFFEICKNKRMVGGNLERTFGMHNVSLVHIRLLSMWHDNLIWKDKHGWYMINPEMTKDQLEVVVSTRITISEYDDYMIEMIQQAIQFKFRPFAMLREKKQKEIEREIALLGTGS